MTWILSAITIFSMWLAGNRNPWAWVVSLLNQALWFTWIVLEGEWGLLPMNLAMVFVSFRNLRKWLNDWLP
jgi:hypothetical protein